jgi:hypothetical protein
MDVDAKVRKDRGTESYTVASAKDFIIFDDDVNRVDRQTQQPQCHRSA